MKYISTYILLIIFFFLCQTDGLIAQATLNLDKSKAIVDPTIPPEMLVTLSATLENAVKDYASYCTLYDTETKSVNSVSVNRFVSLFDASAAMLCKDFLFDSITTQFDINEYFIQVMESPMNSTGIEAVVSSPVLTEMYRDVNSPDQIISKVVITKILKNYLQDKSTGYFLKPVTRKLVLTYKTPAYYLEEALISSIEYYSPILALKPVTVVPITPLAETRKCILIDANSVLPEGVNEDTLVLIEKLICDALEQYRATASLFDSTAGAVTGASASRFQQLFSTGSSLHLSDYREYPENIEVTEYREEVFKFFRSTGVQFELTNPRIQSISYDPDGFYFIKVLVTKEVPEYLDDESYEIKKSGKNRSFEYAIDYILVERTMIDPLIEKAIPLKAIAKPEEKRTLLSFGPNLSSGLVSGSPKTGYESITDNTNLSSSLGLGFQVDLISNFTANHRAIKKPLFLAVGLGFQSFAIEAEASDLHFVDTLMTIDFIEGDQSKEISVLKDRIPIQVISLPLGIEYRLIGSESKKFELFLGGKIVPSFLLSSQSSFDANGFYNLSYPQYGFSFYADDKEFQLKPAERSGIDDKYGIGSFNVDDNKSSEIDGKFLLGYKLETSMLLRLSAKFYLNARIGYGGYFGEIIAPSEVTPEFPLDEKPERDQIVDRSTLFEDYYSKVNLSYLSFSVGLAYMLK